MITKLGLGLVSALALLIPANAALAATKIRVSETGIQQYRIVLYAAMINGYFANEGLDVELVDTRAGADSMKLLASGATQFESSVPLDIVNARKQGLDIKAIAMLDQRLNNSIIVQKSLAGQIKSFADIGNHTVGVASIGSGQWQAAALVAKQAGIDPEKLNFIATGPDLAQAAFESGRIDVLSFNDPLDIALVDAGKGDFLVDFTDDATHKKLVGDQILFTDIAVTADYMKANPQIVQSFVNAIQKGMVWVKAHSPEEWADLLQKNNYFNTMDKAVLVKSLQRMASGVPESAMVTPEAVKSFLDMSDSLGLLKGDEGLTLPLTFEAMVDNSYAKAAIAAQ
ncbi:MAG TPA: ABC transporter substrate-binding protein [Devosiaceae bacterium]|jgi:NitT/TauT family transport system substrate-binding protein